MEAALGRPGVRVRTVVRLRWIAVLGQLLTLGVIGSGLGYPLPYASTLAAVAAAVLLNLGLTALYPRHARLVGGEALLHFAFDLVQLGVLLFLTGGLANPFCVLLVVPVTISATLLSARSTAALLATAFAMLVALWAWALPLPWDDHPIFLPPLYRLGILLGLALAMAFLSVYAWQVSAEARRRQLALVATQAALEREGKMSALGSLAAAAAHELGGPLGTITLVARDLGAALGSDPRYGDDVRLLAQETDRARGLLLGIARRAEAQDPFPRVAPATLLHEIAQPHDNRGTQFVFAVDPTLAGEHIARTPELLHGLANLLDNAVRHARAEVALRFATEGNNITLAIEDDGPGFPETLLPHLGEPFLGPSRSGRGGTGLGLFIATTLIERARGRIRFTNRPGGGARVAITWPRTHIFTNPDTETSPWPAPR